MGKSYKDKFKGSTNNNKVFKGDWKKQRQQNRVHVRRLADIPVEEEQELEAEILGDLAAAAEEEGDWDPSGEIDIS